MSKLPRLSHEKKENGGSLIRSFTSESAAVNAKQTAGLEDNVGKSKNMMAFSIPQLGQPLFVQIDGEMLARGRVIACKLCKDAVTGEKFVRVKTNVFPDGFDVYPVQDVVMPEI